MKRKYFFLVVIILSFCTGIIALWSNRERPLCSVLPDDDIRRCASYGYDDGMESVVIGAIPKENIDDFFDLTTVKKGTSFKSLPSPCFVINAVYDNEKYVIVVGADKSVSVAPTSKPDSRTFWVDTSGKLFESLYSIHLENGGTEFP